MLLKLLLEMFFHMLRMWPYVSLHALKLHTWSIRFTRIGWLFPRERERTKNSLTWLLEIYLKLSLLCEKWISLHSGRWQQQQNVRQILFVYNRTTMAVFLFTIVYDLFTMRSFLSLKICFCSAQKRWNRLCCVHLVKPHFFVCSYGHNCQRCICHFFFQDRYWHWFFNWCFHIFIELDCDVVEVTSVHLSR